MNWYGKPATMLRDPAGYDVAVVLREGFDLAKPYNACPALVAALEDARHFLAYLRRHWPEVATLPACIETIERNRAALAAAGERTA